MDKQHGARPPDNAGLQGATPLTYSELGIDKTSVAREQLVKRAFDEERILDICAELLCYNQGTEK